MTPLGWSGWDQERVMLSTVRLTWCMMDTVDGAAGGWGDNKNNALKDAANQSADNLQHLESFRAVS